MDGGPTRRSQILSSILPADNDFVILLLSIAQKDS
jgi:hypothetical protein